MNAIEFIEQLKERLVKRGFEVYRVCVSKDEEGNIQCICYKLRRGQEKLELQGCIDDVVLEISDKRQVYFTEKRKIPIFVYRSSYFTLILDDEDWDMVIEHVLWGNGIWSDTRLCECDRWYGE